MLEKLLGLIDLLAAISIVLLAFDVGHGFATVMMVLLIIKSLVFITSFASWVDLASGAVIGITIFYGINIWTDCRFHGLPLSC